MFYISSLFITFISCLSFNIDVQATCVDVPGIAGPCSDQVCSCLALARQYVPLDNAQAKSINYVRSFQPLS